MVLLQAGFDFLFATDSERNKICNYRKLVKFREAINTKLSLNKYKVTSMYKEDIFYSNN